MSAEEERAAFDADLYEEEVDEYDEADYEDEDEDGLVEEVDDEVSEGELEEIGAEADDEEEEVPGARPGGDQGQVVYIPGIGYIPLASVANIPGLNLGGMAGGRPGAPAAAPAPEGQRPWKGLSEWPESLQAAVGDLVNELRKDGKEELTLLLLGKGGVGKSSTVNSLLNERAANVLAFQQDGAKPTAFSRCTPDDFVLTIIDTPSILEQDAVSEGRLEAIGRAVPDRGVDAVFYLDRLDSYSVDALDRAVIAGITRVLGPQIWDNTVLCLTHASEASAPPGVDFFAHVDQRSEQLRQAIRKIGGTSADLPLALVENSSQCLTDVNGEKIVPSKLQASLLNPDASDDESVVAEVPWVGELLSRAVEVALNCHPYEYQPVQAAKAADPNRRRKWLIPVVLAAQVAVKLLLDRVLDDDGCKGDLNGPFDYVTVAERREELQEQRERAARRRQKQRDAKAAAAAAPEDDEVATFDEEDDDDWEE